MSVVSAARVEDFKQYCAGVRLSQTMQQQVALFLAKLSGAKDSSTVEYICEEAKAALEQQYKNDNTRAAYMTRYRKAIMAMSADRTFPDSVMYEQPTVDGAVQQHLALKWMNYSREFHQARQEKTKTKSKAQRRERVGFELDLVIKAAASALTSDSHWEVCAALILLTGRRPTEIIKTAEFTQSGPYQLTFAGQLKARENDPSYEIYCLVRSHLVIDAFTRFRRVPAVRKLQKAKNAEVDSKLNATINRAVREVFPTSILYPPIGEDHLSAKNLRAAYTNIAYHLFSQPQTSISSFAEDYLGHQSSGSAASYEDYYCVDENNQPLAVGLLRDELEKQTKRPRARKRTTVHVDGLLKERFEAFGSGTHKQKMAQLLDAADRVKQLERQLYNSQQRLELAQKHISLLKEKHSEVKQEQGAIAHKKQKQKRGATDSSSHTPIPDDWTEMSNAELNGSQIPGSADEKIRRSIEAFKAFNEGKQFKEQWSIVPTVIQRLSGSNHNGVKDYLKRHTEVAEALEKYNEEQGYGYHQNRGKGHPREHVKWLATYGKYEW